MTSLLAKEISCPYHRIIVLDTVYLQYLMERRVYYVKDWDHNRFHLSVAVETQDEMERNKISISLGTRRLVGDMYRVGESDLASVWCVYSNLVLRMIREDDSRIMFSSHYKTGACPFATLRFSHVSHEWLDGKCMYLRRVCNSDDVVALGEVDSFYPCGMCSRSEHSLDVTRSVIETGRSPSSFELYRFQVFRPRIPISFNISRHCDLSEVGASMDGPTCRIPPVLGRSELPYLRSMEWHARTKIHCPGTAHYEEA